MDCSGCSVSDLNFEVKFKGQANISVIPHVVEHMERRGFWLTRKDHKVQLDEKGAREFLDFCMDILQPEEMEFRVNQQNWRPVEEIEQVFEMEWIDDVIKHERLTCHYQPIVDRDAQVYGYEMLSRFQNEDGTMIYPNEIFPAAKSRGRLYALDRVCRMTAVKYAAALEGKKAFINFIPTSIYSPESCLRSTTDLALQLGVDPAQLVFEVVETEQVEDMNHLKRILAYYKDKGFHYALDDVGEGYSTIEMLAELEPQYMKLDMQFVNGVAADVKKQQVARKFLEKSLEIGSTPLAEGIETREDFEWLKAQGYQLFQGYYFGKPAAAPLQKIAVN